VEHRRDVSSGVLCGSAAQRVCGGVERARGRAGLARETVRKMLRYRLPPGYRRAQPIRRPKLDAFTGGIDQILREDQHRPKKQRHTASLNDQRSNDLRLRFHESHRLSLRKDHQRDFPVPDPCLPARLQLERVRADREGRLIRGAGDPTGADEAWTGVSDLEPVGLDWHRLVVLTIGRRLHRLGARPREVREGGRGSTDRRARTAPGAEFMWE